MSKFAALAKSFKNNGGMSQFGPESFKKHASGHTPKIADNPYAGRVASQTIKNSM